MLVRSLDDYGGAFADYAPVTDPTTDESARFRNRCVTDVSMMTHTAVRAISSFVGATGVAPTEPLDFVHDAMWGNSNAVKPVFARTGVGIWTITYPVTVSDDLTAETADKGGGVSHSVNFRRAFAQAHALAGVLKHAVAEVTAPNVITVRGFLANGTADELNGVTVNVWAY